MTEFINILRRLTPAGRVLAGAAALIALVFCVVVFKSCTGSSQQSGPDLSVPADTGGYDFPFKDESQAEDFAAKSKPVTNQCTFSGERYAQLRGMPLSFDVFIPPQANRSPYYITDVKSNMEYVPAYFVAPTATGMRDVLEWSASPGEAMDSMPDCIQATGGQLLLAFERGQRPINQNLLNIEGLIWFDSASVRPAEAETATSAALPTVPVVAVGKAEPVSFSRVADPPQDTVVLNTAVRRSDAVLRASRMEFTETESRVYLELLGTGARSAGTYPFDQVQLRQNGAQAQSADIEHLGDTGALLDENPALADLLPDEPIPAAGSGKLAGYLVFPPVDRTKTLFLRLPKPGPQPGTPLTITIPSSKNS